MLVETSVEVFSLSGAFAVLNTAGKWSCNLSLEFSAFLKTRGDRERNDYSILVVVGRWCDSRTHYVMKSVVNDLVLCEVGMEQWSFMVWKTRRSYSIADLGNGNRLPSLFDAHSRGLSYEERVVLFFLLTITDGCLGIVFPWCGCRDFISIFDGGFLLCRYRVEMRELLLLGRVAIFWWSSHVRFKCPVFYELVCSVVYSFYLINLF